jgi:hypothetical protein
MFRLLAAVPALALVALSGSYTPADDKKDAKDTPFAGKFNRESNGLDLSIEFVSKDKVKISAAAGDNGITVTCKYSVDKDTVKAKITDVEMKGNFPAKPPKDLEFSFKWKVKGDTGTLDDLKGDGIEDAKAAFEGEWQKEKKK